jgi:hypothetical protein
MQCPRPSRQRSHPDSKQVIHWHDRLKLYPINIRYLAEVVHRSHALRIRKGMQPMEIHAHLSFILHYFFQYSFSLRNSLITLVNFKHQSHLPLLASFKPLLFSLAHAHYLMLALINCLVTPFGTLFFSIVFLSFFYFILFC